MDVNQAAVERTMRELDVALLLHGHTHRPAVHRFALDGRPAARIVLGAWYEQASDRALDRRAGSRSRRSADAVVHADGASSAASNSLADW